MCSGSWVEWAVCWAGGFLEGGGVRWVWQSMGVGVYCQVSHMHEHRVSTGVMRCVLYIGLC